MLCITALFPSYTHSDQMLPIVKEEVVTLSPIEYVDQYASQYQVDASLLKKVMKCESSNNPKAVGDGGRARNVMQFHKPTFYSYSKKLGEELDYNSYQDQIKLAAYMFSINQGSHWTCLKMVTGR